MQREDVPAASLRDVAVAIEQHGVIATLVVGFEQRVGEVDAGEIFHRRVDRLRRRAQHRTDADIDAVLHPVLGNDAVIGHRPGQETVLAAPQILEAVRRRASCRQDIDHRPAKARPAHAFHQNVANLVAPVRQGLEAPLGNRSVPSVEMVFHAEKTALDDVQGVIGHVGQQEAEIGHRNPHILLCAIFAVDIPDTVREPFRCFRHWDHLRLAVYHDITSDRDDDCQHSTPLSWIAAELMLELA